MDFDDNSKKRIAPALFFKLRERDRETHTERERETEGERKFKM